MILYDEYNPSVIESGIDICHCFIYPRCESLFLHPPLFGLTIALPLVLLVFICIHFFICCYYSLSIDCNHLTLVYPFLPVLVGGC